MSESELKEELVSIKHSLSVMKKNYNDLLQFVNSQNKLIKKILDDSQSKLSTFQFSEPIPGVLESNMDLVLDSSDEDEDEDEESE